MINLKNAQISFDYYQNNIIKPFNFNVFKIAADNILFFFLFFFLFW